MKANIANISGITFTRIHECQHENATYVVDQYAVIAIQLLGPYMV